LTVIRTSRAGEVDRLITALRDGSAVQREAAVARLRVVGRSALARVMSLLAGDTPPETRVAALNVLDGIDHPGALDAAIGSLPDTNADVAAAAITVLRRWLTREPGTRALDALAAVALDGGREPRVRRTAIEALSDLPRELVGPIVQRGGALLAAAPPEAPAVDDPAAARAWIAAHATAPLSELHDVIVRLREREAQDTSLARRQAWLLARAAAHVAIARQGSRVALYDLREVFDAARAPLPLDFLTAVTEIGDASCLEPMARAWAAAPAGETWWKARLSQAAEAIVHRTRLSGRSAVMKRIRTKWSGFL
jgi:hypothetical protein